MKRKKAKRLKPTQKTKKAPKPGRVNEITVGDRTLLLYSTADYRECTSGCIINNTKDRFIMFCSLTLFKDNYETQAKLFGMIVSAHRNSFPEVAVDLDRGLSNGDRIRMCKQLTVRLRHLHDANVIHGGINAHAILLNDDNPKKIDAVFSVV